MKKLTLSIMLLLATSIGATAKSLVLTLVDGTKVYYLLGGAKDPMLRFVDGKVTVDADTYEFSGIKNFYISDEDDPTAIDDVLAGKNISYRDGVIVVNATGVQRVAVYALNGAAVEADVAKADDVITISLAALPSGSYVVKVDGASFKVSKK